MPGLPGIPGVPDHSDLFSGDIPGLGGISNPLDGLGEAIAKAAADAWTAAMLAIWSSGLFILRIVLTFSEMFLTPDLRADGPGKDVYAFTLWLAGALVVILTLVQLGAAAFKREGKGLARALIGAGQFVLVCACWFGYCTIIVAACGGADPRADEGAARRQHLARLGAAGRPGNPGHHRRHRRHRARLPRECSCGSPRSATSWSTSPAPPPCWC